MERWIDDRSHSSFPPWVSPIGQNRILGQRKQGDDTGPVQRPFLSRGRTRPKRKEVR